ncbi:sodium:solute symporter family transporter [Schlesneria paludicola]|uniref:sodium:solute symporter family transporter n=1 Tax=Schlesneria paludicola TaxID=360056 RepID=UPI00029AB378|nr:sodium:solute symporter [Schlesneria paludicola]
MLAATDLNNPGYSVLLALLLFIAASVWLGTVAQKAMEKKDFLKGFFLGNRGLGAWALALTATVQSGGTFMGFPALVYSHGWIVLLWIGSYMVVPLMGFAVVGKRLAHLSRLTDSFTVPDLLRERFADPRIGLVSSIMIITFMSFTMFAQFKAGATIMKHAWPGSGVLSLSEDYEVPSVEKSADGKAAAPAKRSIDKKYYVGLVVFTLTVVGYTLIGGFLASVWTDLFQSIMMVIGVMILLFLALPMAGGLEQASRTAIEVTSPEIAMGPGFSKNGREFLTPGLAISMFVIWVFGGFVSPASMVRVMAASNTEVMRKSICLLSCYNCLIYIPLVMICIAAHTILPGLSSPDEVIPRLAMTVTEKLPFGSFISGLILAAPFGAIMASVSCFILVISSGLVQDIYVRFLHPTATEAQVRRATNVSMIGVGLIAILANLNPPTYLQALVVISGSGGGAAFTVPVLMACYWRRTTAAGMLAGMLVGFFCYFGLSATGWIQNWAMASMETNELARSIISFLGADPMIGIQGIFRPYYVFGLDPVVWAILASAIAGIGTTLITTPPPEEHVSRFFDIRTA